MFTYLILSISCKLSNAQTWFQGWGNIPWAFSPVPAPTWEWASLSSSVKWVPWATAFPFASRKWLETATQPDVREPRLVSGLGELLNDVRRMGTPICICFMPCNCASRTQATWGHGLKWRLLSPITWSWIPDHDSLAWVTLGKWFNLSVLKFLIDKMGVIVLPVL